MLYRIFTAITLLLIAGSAMAANTDALSHVHQFAANLAPPETDYSVAYLSQIFGTVGNVLEGGSGQILGKMFSIFNKGVLVAAALWLGYITFNSVLRAATEGTFTGQQVKTHHLLLRIACAFALVIPSATTGYSLLQDIFMKVVIEGVGLADQTWDAALKYLQYGGQLYIPPSTLGTDQNIISSAVGATNNGTLPPKLPVVTQIFQNEVCMYASSSDWQKKYNPSVNTALTGDFQPYFIPPHFPSTASKTTETPGQVFFPGLGNTQTEVAAGTAQNCGSVTAFQETAQSGKGLNSHKDQEVLSAYSYSAMKQLVISLLPAAREYVYASERNNPYEDSSSKLSIPANLSAPSAGTSSFLCANSDQHASSGEITCPSGEDSNLCSSACSLLNNNAKTVFSAMLGYGNLITPYQNLMTNGSSTHAFIQKSRAQGWIMAGAWYWRVEQMNKNAQAESISNLIPNVYSGPQPSITPNNNQFLSTAALNIMGYVPLMNIYWSQYIGAEQNTVTGSAGGAPSTTSFANAMAGSAVHVFSGFGLGSNAYRTYNPIVILMHFGNRLLTGVVAMWMAGIGLSVGLMASMAFCSATLPTKAMASSALAWTKSIMMLITAALMVPGCILAYYVPFYPFIVFTFAAVGWIVLVIEGMAAAPIVCLGMTHPEGHDFMGKAEQALMLFLSIFLRPALMIIGLIAAMIVSFAAFQMLTTGFGTVLASLMNKGGAAFNNPFLILISMVMVWVIFGMMTMELIEQCYKLIYQLPNKIMSWIGGPTSGEEYGQMAQGVKGAVSSGAGSVGQGIGKLGEGGMDAGAKAGDKLGGKAGGGDVSVTPGDK